MQQWLFRALRIRTSETSTVSNLFLVQFLLGIATSFLFTSSLAFFLTTFGIEALPRVYITSAVLLIGFNYLYGWLDEHMSAKRLLRYVILFSAAVVLFLLTASFFIQDRSLAFITACSYMIIYMLAGYAFWGMAAVLFNVRESRRVFSIVGAGDIPAKILGYLSVSVLVPFIGIMNLLWVSLFAFIGAYIVLNKFVDPKGLVDFHDNNDTQDSAVKNSKTWLQRKLPDSLVGSIAMLSLLGYAVFALVDFTFLSEVKFKYKTETQLATFLSIFFATGRTIALFIKVFVSSRLIARLGLIRPLLLTPMVLFIGCFVVNITGDMGLVPMYVFGAMVMFSEVLRSTVYEPIFFILFQPLAPHSRLRGHLFAKGYTMPLALIPAGTFLAYYVYTRGSIDIIFISQLLMALLVVWVLVIVMIRNVYLKTLLKSIQKGYFRGSELFLNDETVELLVSKVHGNKPAEVIYALNLLERAGYRKLDELLISKLDGANRQIERYALLRIVALGYKQALPAIKSMADKVDDSGTTHLLEAVYFLEDENLPALRSQVDGLDLSAKEGALAGLLKRKNSDLNEFVKEKLQSWSLGSGEEKLLVLRILERSESTDYPDLLELLLADKDRKVVRKAIEVTGACRCFDLIEPLYEAARKNNLWVPLKAALISMGDIVFEKQELKKLDLYTQKELLFQVAARIRTQASTEFLVSELAEHPRFISKIIEALWKKKARLSSAQMINMRQHGSTLLENTIQKLSIRNSMQESADTALLKNALESEIRHDITTILKTYSMSGTNDVFERVLDLLQRPDQMKLSNAIESLDMTMEKKDFLKLNRLLEHLLENSTFEKERNNQSAETVMQLILERRKTMFNRWTRSVACYILPKSCSVSSFIPILVPDDDRKMDIFNETRQYILSGYK